MDIQLASLSQDCLGKTLIVNHSRLMNSAKSYLKKIKYFNVLFNMILVRHNYNPFTLTVIMRSRTLINRVLGS